MSIASSNSHHAESSASAVSTTPIALSASPIQELPSELLEETFLYHMPPDGSKALFVQNDCWTLVNVCRSWRKVATQCPLLWREIEVPVRDLAARCSNPVALLSLVISRSKSIDLFITFDATGVEDDAGNLLSELALTLLNVLMERSVQWRLVDFVELDAPCVRALDGVQGRLPRLMELYVTRPHPEAQLELTGFTLAPLLERVCFDFSEEIGVGCIPMRSQLTAFVVKGAYYDSSLVDLLRHCRRLQVLRVQFLQPSRLPVDKRLSSQITNLIINGFFSDLTLVHLPQLRTLSIGNMDSISLDSILPSVLALLKHSRCPLVSLELINCDLAGLVAVLELVPQLQKLTIVFDQFLPDTAAFVSGVDQALSALMMDLEKVDLLPNLQQLLLLFLIPKKSLASEFTFFKNEGVAAMLRRRSAQCQLEAYCRFDFEEVYIAEDGWLGSVH